MAKTKTSKLAITSGTLGIFSLVSVLFLPIIGCILGIASIVFGIIASIEMEKNPSLSGKGYIIIGFLFSLLALYLFARISILDYLELRNIQNQQYALDDISSILKK